MSVIGIDTSNYTTSIAFFDGIGGENCSKLLPVKQGELGLRQSDAVFAHIKSLPELSGRLFSHVRKDARRDGTDPSVPICLRSKVLLPHAPVDGILQTGVHSLDPTASLHGSIPP